MWDILMWLLNVWAVELHRLTVICTATWQKAPLTGVEFAATLHAFFFGKGKGLRILNIFVPFFTMWWRWEKTYSRVASWSSAWPTPRPSAGDGWPRSVAFLSDWPHWWPGLGPLCGWPRSCRVRTAETEIPVYTGQCREACWETCGSASAPSGTDTKTLLVT